jgi:initiation factor 1A
VYAEGEIGERYARCIGTLGGGRVLLQLQCGTEVNGKVKGSMYKRVWVNKGDLVIATERRVDGTVAEDLSTTKFDIVHKFSPEDERLLSRYGEIGTWGGDEGDEGGDVVFCDVDDI